MQAKTLLRWTARFIALFVLYGVFFIAGSLLLTGYLPDLPSEPGLVTPGSGLLVIELVNTLLIMAVILTSRWSGWKLALIVVV